MTTRSLPALIVAVLLCALSCPGNCPAATEELIAILQRREALQHVHVRFTATLEVDDGQPQSVPRTSVVDIWWTPERQRYEHITTPTSKPPYREVSVDLPGETIRVERRLGCIWLPRRQLTYPYSIDPRALGLFPDDPFGITPAFTIPWTLQHLREKGESPVAEGTTGREYTLALSTGADMTWLVRDGRIVRVEQNTSGWRQAVESTYADESAEFPSELVYTSLTLEGEVDLRRRIRVELIDTDSEIPTAKFELASLGLAPGTKTVTPRGIGVWDGSEFVLATPFLPPKSPAAVLPTTPQSANLPRILFVLNSFFAITSLVWWYCRRDRSSQPTESSQ